MAQSTLSLLGLYNYDDTILNDLALPPALEEKRDIITGNLLLESAEMEILFPDPDVMRSAIKFWSRKCLPVWQELYDTTMYEYNPIWNKDGTFTELETRDLAGKEIRNMSGEDRRTRNGNESRTQTVLETRNLAGSETEEGSGSTDTDNYVFGYNSETAAHESKSTEESDYSRENSSTQTGTINTANTDSINNTDTEVNNSSSAGTVDNTDTGTIKRERTEQGNIGVTSTQSLILEQRNVVEFNIMDRIIKDFIARFCILVY